MRRAAVRAAGNSSNDFKSFFYRINLTFYMAIITTTTATTKERYENLSLVNNANALQFKVRITQKSNDLHDLPNNSTFKCN